MQYANKKLQTFYSGRIRYLAHGRYENQKEKLENNSPIRNKIYPQLVEG